MQDIRPLGLCVSTLDLFDTKKFLLNYADAMVLRGDDPRLATMLTKFRRELNSSQGQMKFLEGYKAVIANNIDKIIALVEARYARTMSADVESVKFNGKRMIERVLNAQSFNLIGSLEDEFKTKIVLPTYRLFVEDLKKSDVKFI